MSGERVADQQKKLISASARRSGAGFQNAGHATFMAELPAQRKEGENPDQRQHDPRQLRLVEDFSGIK